MFARGQHVVLFGLVEMRGHGGLQLTNPQYEILDDEDADTIHTGRIVPVYEKAGSVTPKMQRRLVYDVLQRSPPDLPDVLPEPVRAPPEPADAAGGATRFAFPGRGPAGRRS